MCGIAGIIDFDQPPDAALAAAMTAVIRHRGPDESGAHADRICALAMRRLAIQDLAHGHQPVYSEDRQVAVILNGEIYNFRELRSLLEKKGHRLASGSDTEVLPHLYEEYGDGFLDRLRGMFAIALWDSGRRRLLLARDRIGKKPLFYSSLGTSFRFASEIKAFFADPAIPREPDLHAVHHFLCLQYVPAPWTAFEGIHSLPPGHLLILTESGTRTESWWSLPPQKVRDMDRQEAAGVLASAVRQAVGVRMVADVPLGAFLSGGVDSACVVAAMAESSSEPVRTFTIGFEEMGDERPLARQVAERFGTVHSEHVVTVDAGRSLPLLVWHYDQPFGDASCLPTYAVAREARAQVTVALNGDGGDEAFAGYERARRIAASASRWAPVRLPALRHLPSRMDPMHPLSRARRLALRRGGCLPDAYMAWVECFPERLLRRVYTREMRDRLDGLSTEALLRAAIAPGDPLWSVLSADYRTYLPGDLLPKVDIATMAVSLEARSPLLDHELIELGATLPSAVKMGPEGGKLALRDAFRGVVPDDVLDGPKRGFSVPLDRWFRTGLAPVARALLEGDGSWIGQLLRPEAVRHLIRTHQTARANHGERLFCLMWLELWHRMFIDHRPPLEPPSDVELADLS